MKNNNKITKYWVSHAIYDLETAGAMYKSRRYLYVTFMCQQSIEKILKAVITTVSADPPPRIHNLVRLSELAGIKASLDQKQVELLAILTPFCIEARYADYQEKIAKLTNSKLAKDCLFKTKELFECLKKMI